MSASVAQVLSSWIRGAGLGRGETLVRRSPLPFPSEDLALTRGRSATPRLLPAMRAGECERRAGVATGTDILRLVARHRGSLHLRGRGRRIPAGNHEETQRPFTAPKPISPAPDLLRGVIVLVVDDERCWRV